MIERSSNPPGNTPRRVFCFGHSPWARLRSAPRHGRFGGSPEPETGESPAAAIFVFPFSIRQYGPVTQRQSSCFASREPGVRVPPGPPFRERSSMARIRARHARDTGSTPVARSKFEACRSTADPTAHNGHAAGSTRSAPIPVQKRCGAEAARLAHNQKAMGSSPITATIVAEIAKVVLARR